MGVQVTRSERRGIFQMLGCAAFLLSFPLLSRRFSASEGRCVGTPRPLMRGVACGGAACSVAKKMVGAGRRPRHCARWLEAALASAGPEAVGAGVTPSRPRTRLSERRGVRLPWAQVWTGMCAGRRTARATSRHRCRHWGQMCPRKCCASREPALHANGGSIRRCGRFVGRSAGQESRWLGDGKGGGTCGGECAVGACGHAQGRAAATA